MSYTQNSDVTHDIDTLRHFDVCSSFDDVICPEGHNMIGQLYIRGTHNI